MTDTREQPEARSALPAKVAAVLCPGESLRFFLGRDGYDPVIAVNRAAGAYHADYWVCLDQNSFEACQPVGRPTIVCAHATYNGICARWPDARHHDWKLHKPGAVETHQIPWAKYSATTALELAARLGATQVDCYGIDWNGTEDFDGYEHAEHNRTAERWADEGRIFADLTAELHRRGVRIRRITILERPAGPQET